MKTCVERVTGNRVARGVAKTVCDRIDRTSHEQRTPQTNKGGVVEDDAEAYSTRPLRRKPPTIGAVSAGEGGATA